VGDLFSSINQETLVTSKYDRYSKEELVKIIEERDRKPRLGLVWERDEIDHDRSMNQDFVALDLLTEHSCGEGPWHNLLIEGDNFDALRYLRMTHAGRVKCIYIDPPYNTGNKDFIYNDRFVDKDDVWKHSKWLEYLYRRLLLARDLLAEDGVLLVSINDENRARLELLLDQALPGMRVGSLVWRTRDSTSAKCRNFSDVHEHILIYGGQRFSFRGTDKTQKKYKNPDKDPRGPWNIDPLTLAFNRVERKNLFYPIKNPKTGNWYPCDPNRVWAYASEIIEKNPDRLRTETMEEWIRQDKIVFPVPESEQVVIWNTLDELLTAIDLGEIPKTPKKQNPLLTRDTPDLDFWVGKPVGFGRLGFKKHWKDLRSHSNPVGSWVARITEDVDEDDYLTLRSRQAGEGTDALQEIFGTKVFNYPKPPSLIKNLIAQSTDAYDLVMDFFAGSGTTAQAVLELNREDEGQRRFIMVSATEATADDPDKNICRDVCAERIRRVIGGYGGKEGTGGDFAYLRVKRIPQEDVLSEIDHAQVWTALQLIHRQSFSAPFDSAQGTSVGSLGERSRTQHPAILSSLLESIDAASGLIYVTSINDNTAEQIAVLSRRTAHLTVYTWQPGLLRERLAGEGITVEQIPQFLVNRFGGAA
jgi:adenine-specific DNA-methyltransferase